MYTELSILAVFFEDPTTHFHIREIARLTTLNHMTARKYLNLFVKEGVLNKKPGKLFGAYSANGNSRKFQNLKLYYNLEKLRQANLIEDLEHFYEYPIIILFGSYAKSSNVKESDIDICVISNIQKKFSAQKYIKILQREVSIHKYTQKEFEVLKTKNPELVNSLCNGIVLSGQLEIL